MRKHPAFLNCSERGPLIDERTPFDSFDFKELRMLLDDASAISRDLLIYSDVIISALH
jgi:hypothetical protein